MTMIRRFPLINVIRLGKDRRGQDVLEYALMVSFLALVAYGFLPQGYAPALSTVWSKVNNVLHTIGNA